MTSILTPDEQAFLKKMEEQKQKHKDAQAKYRLKNKNKMNEYNKVYQENQRLKKIEINQKLLKEPAPPPEPINIQDLSKRTTKINKRTRKGKQQAKQPEIIPSYQSRKEPLTITSINDYLSKSNLLNKLFNDRPLPQPVKAELKKLLNDNPDLNKSIILNEMSFINNDIDNTINIIRQSYINDNSFKTYINVLAVITSHLKDLEKEYLIYTKLGKSVNKKVEEVREDNQISEEDKGKIINVGDQEYIKNVNKLDNIEDILIYALYMLIPARRLDYRNMLITNEKDVSELNDINYLLMPKASVSTDGNKQTFIFNDYKTYTTYKKQVFEVPEALNAVISKYIYIKKLKAGDYLFSLLRDRREPITQGNFSQKISNVFNKIYNIPISIRFIRMSWASDLYRNNPSIKQIKDLSYKMGHSPAESRLYNKIFKA